MKSNGWQILEVNIKCHIFIYTQPSDTGSKVRGSEFTLAP